MRERFGENGEELVAFLADVVEGRATGDALGRSGGETVPVEIGPSIREKTDAVELLLAYGWGKPSQALEVSGPAGGPIPVAPVQLRLDHLSDEELTALESLIQRALPPATAEVVDADFFSVEPDLVAVE